MWYNIIVNLVEEFYIMKINHVLHREYIRRNESGVAETRLFILLNNGNTQLLRILPGEKPRTRTINFHKRMGIVKESEFGAYEPNPYDSLFNRESTLKDLINDIDNGTFC